MYGAYHDCHAAVVRMIRAMVTATNVHRNATATRAPARRSPFHSTIHAMSAAACSLSSACAAASATHSWPIALATAADSEEGVVNVSAKPPDSAVADQR